MSTRGREFLERWLADNVPDLVGADDVISAGTATDKLFADLKSRELREQRSWRRRARVASMKRSSTPWFTTIAQVLRNDAAPHYGKALPVLSNSGI
jgi:hypothetical protein